MGLVHTAASSSLTNFDYNLAMSDGDKGADETEQRAVPGEQKSEIFHTRRRDGRLVACTVSVRAELNE